MVDLEQDAVLELQELEEVAATGEEDGCSSWSWFYCSSCSVAC